MKSVKAFLFCVAAILTVAFAVTVSKPYNAVSAGTGSDANSNIISTENPATLYDASNLSVSVQAESEEDISDTESESERSVTDVSLNEDTVNAQTKNAEAQNTVKSTVMSATSAPSTTKKSVTSTTQKETTTRKSTATAPVQAEENEQMTVYYTKTGKRYHYKNPCGNGNFSPTTLAEAKKMGLTPCQKCVLH